MVITSTPGKYLAPRLSPDGKTVAYVKSRGSFLTSPWQGLDTGVYAAQADGKGEPQRISKDGDAPIFGARSDEIFITRTSQPSEVDVRRALWRITLPTRQETEVAQLARAFDHYQARLDSLLRREQEFTANASHELRTPLTAIHTSCELLADDRMLAPKSAQRVAAIAKAARRMSTEIEALLLLAREQAPGEDQTVSVAEIVNDMVEPYRTELRDRGLGLDIDIAPDAVLTLNPRVLQLVISNLVRNAIQCTVEGRIGIRFHDDALEISDTGVGIPASQLDRIFERYYRVDDARPGGTGLGLAIAKRVCDQFGWRIHAASVEGQGSTFTLRFKNNQ